MLVLAIDCAHNLCAIALYDSMGDRVLDRRDPDIGRGHAEILPGLYQELEHDFKEIERIAVTVGPGSFAGIRTGLAFARGLALGLGVPAVGVSGLIALAAPCAMRCGMPVMAALDAGQGRVWTTLCASDGSIFLEPAELTVDEASYQAAGHGALVIGSARAYLVEANPTLSSENFMSDGNENSVAPDIVDVARLAARLDPVLHPAEPVYLREPDAKPQSGFVLARVTG